MRLAENYTFISFLDQSYLLPIGSKTFIPSDAISFNETGSFLIGEIVKGIDTKENLIKRACNEFEVENLEEEKEVADMVQEFIMDCIQKGYIEAE